MSTSNQLVSLTKRGPIAVVRMERPEALNAISGALADSLAETFLKVALDDEVWVVVLTATGEKAFCVGADLKERAGFTLEEFHANRAQIRGLFASIRAVPQPTVASIFGFALGGGFELALSCDLIVAADGTQMGLPEVRVGLLPAGGGTQLLTRRLGTGRAKEMIFRGRRFDAAEAQDLGLVVDVVERDRLEDRTMEIAADICASSPVAVRAAKRSIDAALGVPLDQGIEIEHESWQEVIASEDRSEGIAAFNEKREPRSAQPLSPVRIREVGPRDGIQSERATIATQDKIRLVDMLSAAGLRHIEVTSFVSPKAVPQMADAAEVFAGIRRRDGVFYSALVPNKRGAEAAVEADADGLQVFIAATDSYNLKNVGKKVEDSLPDVQEVVSVAQGAGLPVEGTLSCAFGDPYEGDVEPERVAEVAGRLFEMGIAAISFGDTTGMGTPRRVRDVITVVRDKLPDLVVNLHLHDTRGTGLANALAGLEMGIDYFDSSVGGMGGSPFASGSTGNICTEDLVHMFEDMGVETGVDLEAVIEAARFMQGLIEGELPSKMLKAGPRWAVKV